jgi:acyl dehydratase
MSMASAGVAISDPGLGLNYAMVVHGEQRFTYERPIVAGDVLIAQPTITEIRDAGRNVMLTTSTQIRTADGELVCTAVGTLVERGA